MFLHYSIFSKNQFCSPENALLVYDLDVVDEKLLLMNSGDYLFFTIKETNEDIIIKKVFDGKDAKFDLELAPSHGGYYKKMLDECELRKVLSNPREYIDNLSRYGFELSVSA